MLSIKQEVEFCVGEATFKGRLYLGQDLSGLKGDFFMERRVRLDGGLEVSAQRGIGLD